MTRHGFIWSLLAMVLGLLGLRAKPRPSANVLGFEEQLRFQQTKDDLESYFRWSGDGEWRFVEEPDPATFYWVYRE